MYWWYLAFLILAIWPIAATGFARSHLFITAAVLTSVLPLFAVSIDYGRWISLMASILSLVALTVTEAMKEWRIPSAPIVWVLYVITWSPTLVEYPLGQTSWVTLVVDGFRSWTGM